MSLCITWQKKCCIFGDTWPAHSLQYTQKMTRAHGTALAPFVQGRQAKPKLTCRIWMLTSLLACGSSHAAADMHKPYLQGMQLHVNNTVVFAFCRDSSPDLHSVMLWFYSLCAEAMECLVIRQESSLQHLVLESCKLDAAAMTCLGKAHFANPAVLDLVINQLRASDMQTLVHCKLPQLHWLKLNDADMTTAAAMQ